MADDFRGAESGHWYASPRSVEMGVARYVGEPVTEVPSSDGKAMVKPDSRHALKFGLASGATSVLKMFAKPHLEKWGEKIIAQASVEKGEDGLSLSDQYSYGRIDFDTYLEKLRDTKKAISTKAADDGSVIHAEIERGILGQPFQTETGQAYFNAVADALGRWGSNEWIPEKPFWHKRGFGGRTDVLALTDETLIVVDFKTRDFTKEQAEESTALHLKNRKDIGKLTPYETEPMQIAANIAGHAYAYEQAGRKVKATLGANLYLSRTDPTAWFVYEYDTIQLSNAWTCFKALLVVYQTQKGITGK